MSEDNIADGDDAPLYELTTETQSRMDMQPVYQLTLEALNRLMAQARQASAAPQQSQPRHKFVRVGIERQYEFNIEILNIISPIAEKAPEEEGVKQDLEKAIDLLKKRNELLIIADGDPSVFNFYDQHKKAEGTTDPILSAFLKKKEKEEASKPKPGTWKIKRFEPYSRVKLPFRVERAAWALAPLNVVPQGIYHSRFDAPQRFDYQSRMAPQDVRNTSNFGPRQMCYRCGTFLEGLQAIRATINNYNHWYVPARPAHGTWRRSHQPFGSGQRPLLGRWRSQGMGVAVYLDDGLIWGGTLDSCAKVSAMIRQDLGEAGFVLAEDKCCWNPSQRVTWLGHVIDLRHMSLDITKERKDRAMEWLQYLLRSRGPPLRERLKWLGLLASMHSVILRDILKKHRVVVSEVSSKQMYGCALEFRCQQSQPKD